MNEVPAPAPAPIPNVLAERYASAAMKDIWSQHGRVGLERDFWIAVMKGQRDLGVPDSGRRDPRLRAGQGARSTSPRSTSANASPSTM